MKLSDLLQDEWIAVPVEAPDFGGALSSLTEGLSPGRDQDAGAALLEALADTEESEVVRVTDDVVLAAASTDLVSGLAVKVGLAEKPFTVDVAGAEGPARVIVLVLSPGPLSAARAHVVPTLTRILRESQRTRELLASRTPLNPAAFTEALNAELHGRLLVEDALTPVRFRVYPDTSLVAVIDLIVRHGLDRVPVVGEAHELLGVITAGDVLEELLPRWRSSGEKPTAPADAVAREVMQRSVMCVSEDQSLVDAANLMVNRDVNALPVVREGVLVGFLHRDTVLKSLFMS